MSKSEMKFDLKQADEIAREYSDFSMIDNGNLFFALEEYRGAHKAALELIERLEETLQFYAEENNYHYSNKNSAREVIDDSDIETCIINVGFTHIDVGAGGKRSREALADIKKFREGL